MNIAKALANYLESIGMGTLGTDIFIGSAPSSNKSKDTIWWIVDTGVSPIQKGFTGGIINQYGLSLYRRSIDYQSVYNDVTSLQKVLSCSSCLQLEGFDTLGTSVNTYPIDQDLDSESRKVGLIQLNIQAYDTCA